MAKGIDTSHDPSRQVGREELEAIGAEMMRRKAAPGAWEGPTDHPEELEVRRMFHWSCGARTSC